MIAAPPKLAKLRYGNPYCDTCLKVLHPGELVGWWKLPGTNGRIRHAVHCKECHTARIRK